MTEQTPEGTQPPTTATQDPPAPDPDAQSPEDTQAVPNTTRGSGQFAVWDHDLGQFVSGVSSKADADKARKGLEAHNGAITDGHKLSTLEV